MILLGQSYSSQRLTAYAYNLDNYFLQGNLFPCFIKEAKNFVDSGCLSVIYNFQYAYSNILGPQRF